ncbi:hypothetical protein BXZ70DRAFT_963582 [Cristinia sonorae]|uniref:Uncharacterized protein n=1 Tax=Cristinia sonorae TaxID=1940300 RepID=A0A8K0UE43_9AGAR|nr:hypothetical protein BXZ70DRAFT_963582 [Cristinia sonorae]
MPSYDGLQSDDVFAASSSRFLAPTAPRKQPSKQNINGRRSSASLRGSSLAQSLEDDAANGRHSLAHELAVALMPEPSAGSKLLAEEFGIEYDEGAEGIDENPHNEQEPVENGHHESIQDAFSSAEPGTPLTFAVEAPPPDDPDLDIDLDPSFGSPQKTKAPPPRIPDQDPMVVLAQDLEYTEKFLSQLRRLDSSAAAQSNMEQLASDMIRRINDTTRDREGQVRELLEYEREFRKISGELGGDDVLGQLDELEDMLVEEPRQTSSHQEGRSKTFETIQEESLSSSQILGSGSDWEADLDRDRERITEEDDEYDSSVYSPSPVKVTFAPPPPINGPPTPASTIPQLQHLRTFTISVASSLATISEQAQVNAAATTEAGRKIRALKNKLGGWRSEWDSAERSRVKIEKWEAGVLDLDDSAPPTPGTPSRAAAVVSKRVDGRKLVKEHMQAFELALLEANTKTQAIMAAVS